MVDTAEVFHIMLMIFSGVPNPQWLIKPDNPLYNTVIGMFKAAKITKTLRDMPSRLGYTGFLVWKSGQTVQSASAIFGSQTKELQKYLLETVPESEVDQTFKEEILKYINEED